ncbi:MAG TPA: hypothetical protein VMG59_02135 [Phycisphaerae bacterium]|nr:hypothetical protein [Phycisphaerae bacterium]
MFEDPRARLKLKPKQPKAAQQKQPAQGSAATATKKQMAENHQRSPADATQQTVGSFPADLLSWVSIISGMYSLGIAVCIAIIVLTFESIAAHISLNALVYFIVFAGLPSLVWTNIVWYGLVHPALDLETHDHRVMEILQCFRTSATILAMALVVIGLADVWALIDVFKNQKVVDVYILVLSIPAVLHCISVFILWRPALATGALTQRWREEDKNAGLATLN